MEQTHVEEIKGFLADQVKTSIETATTELKSKLDTADNTIKELRAEIETLKTKAVEQPATPRIETQEDKLDKWALYYKNLFYAVNPQQQVTLRNKDGGERVVTITSSQRIKAFEVLENIAGKAALNEGTNTQGGYVVPTPQDLIGEIMRIAQPASLLLQEANVFPMRSMTLPLTTEGTGVSVVWENEAATLDETEPTLKRFTLTAKKLAAYSKVSNELLADADASVVGYLNMILGEAVGVELDKQGFRGGSATSHPFLGVLYRTGVNEVTMGTGSLADAFSDITPTHLSQMISKLSDLYTRGAKFYAHRTVEHYFRTFKDSNGNALYYPYQSMGGGAERVPGGEVFGYPVVRAEQMPTTAASAANKCFVIFGNLKNYWVGKRQDMTFAIDPYGLFINDQVRLRVTTRWALGLPLPTTMVRMKV